MKKKTILTLLAAAVLATGGIATVGAMSTDRYKDVQTDDSFYSAVEDMTDFGIMDGQEDNTKVFGIEQSVNRVDFITCLYKAVNTPDVSGTSAFTDLTDLKNAEKNAILWAEQNHIFDDLADDFFTEDAFDAEKDITREEAAVMLYNVAEHVLNIDMTKDVRENLSDFEDGNVVADDYVDAVLWAVGNDILTPGTTDEKADDYDEAIAGLLHLDKTITKVETAEAISRLLDLVEDEDVVTAKTEYEDAQEAADDENTASAPAADDTNDADSNTPADSDSDSDKADAPAPIVPETPGATPIVPSEPEDPTVPSQPETPETPDTPDEPEEHVHNFVEAVLTEPTCTEPGEQVKYCTDCDYEIFTELAALGHNFVLTDTVDPTCGTDGKNIYTCDRCDESKEEAIPATGDHAYVETIVTEPGCETEGVKQITCENCDYETTETIPATGHDYVLIGTMEPTCGVDGLNYYQCSVCGDEKDEVIPATGEHNIIEFVKTEPTCEDEGLKQWICTVCGDIEKEEAIPATGHSYTESIVTKPTCGAEGLKKFTCDTCGDTKTETIPATGNHDYAETIVKEPTCTEPGLKNQVCNVCGDTKESVTIPALGHDYVLTDSIEATCGSDGKNVYTCSRCGDTKTETVPATGEHSYTFTVTKEPGCETDGERTYTCTVCNDSYTETIPATGHNYTSAVTTPPTCVTEGVRTYTCTNCGDSYTEAIPVSEDHQWVHHEATGHYETVTIEEGWTEVKYEGHYICNGCGGDFGQDQVALVNHIATTDCFGSGYHTETVEVIIEHPPVTEDRWVEDTPAYDECSLCHKRK